MKIFDPAAIVPYQILEVDDAPALVEERNRRRANGPQPMAPMTPDMEARYLQMVAKDRADRAWLTSNAPMGTVFDFLGVAHMVLSFPYTVNAPERPGPSGYEVKVACPNGTGGIVTTSHTCLQMRAILEPRFVCP